MTTCFGQWFRTFSLTSFAKIFGTFSAFQKGTPVNKEGRYKNVPKYSCFGFQLSRYIFPKLLVFQKALLKRMALVPAFDKRLSCFFAFFFALKERTVSYF